MSNILHKVKDAMTHDHHDRPSDSTNAGPHDSNVTNKMDPRVDSDRDGRAAQGYGGATGTHHAGTQRTGPPNTYGSSTTTGTGNTFGSDTVTGAGYGSGSTNAGPHSSNLANKVDPRVDSDLDNRGTRGGVTGGNTFGTTGATGGAYGSEAYGGSGLGAGTGTTTTGPHSSNLANKMDPRVDSDRGYAGTTGGVTAGSGHNYNTRSGNAGPHDYNISNKLDPRVDSDLDNRARHQQLSGSNAPAGSSYTTPGSGNTQQTAGPHDSNLLNKMDPRVDSDLDGSRTMPGNVTRQ